MNIYVYICICIVYVCMYVAQSVCQRAFSLLANWCLGSRVQILLSAEEHNLSPFDLNIACLCQSIEININKHVYIYIYIYIYMPLRVKQSVASHKTPVPHMERSQKRGHIVCYIYTDF